MRAAVQLDANAGKQRQQKEGCQTVAESKVHASMSQEEWCSVLSRPLSNAVGPIGNLVVEFRRAECFT